MEIDSDLQKAVQDALDEKNNPLAGTQNSDTKIKKSETYMYFEKIINHDKDKPWPNLVFPERFAVTIPPGVPKGKEAEARQIISIDQNEVCTPVGQSQVVHALSRFIALNHSINRFQTFNLTPDEARSCVQQWFDRSEVIATPKMVSEIDEPGLTYSRMPWKLDLASPTPLFNELLSRVDNSDALLAFVGSLFFEQSYKQEYLFFLGQGNDGKGSICHFLSKVFKNASTTHQSTPINYKNGGKPDPHFAATLVGKRLCIFDDIQDTAFARSGFLKGLTGGEALYVNPKFKEPYEINHNVKFIITSNAEPQLDLSRNCQRRIILCNFEPPADLFYKEGTTYADELWKEGGGFLAACKMVYQSLCPNHERIPRDQSLAMQIASEQNSGPEGVFNAHFEIGTSEDYVTASEFNETLKLKLFDDSRKVADVKKLIAAKYQISRSQVTIDDKRVHVYRKLKRKD